MTPAAQITAMVCITIIALALIFVLFAWIANKKN